MSITRSSKYAQSVSGMCAYIDGNMLPQFLSDTFCKENLKKLFYVYIE